MSRSLTTAIAYYAELEFTRGVIIGLATALKRPVTYAEVAEALGKNTRGLGPLLGDLVAVDVDAERPITSALVINARKGMPGDGFVEALMHNKCLAKGICLSAEEYEVLWHTHLATFPFVVPPAYTHL